MTESRPDDIADAIVATLSAIVGDGVNYNYTPATVVRSHVVTVDMLNANYDPTYILTPDRKEERPRSSLGPGGIIRGRAYWTLTLCKVHNPQTENPVNVLPPFTPPSNGETDPPSRWTVEERMQRDVKKALRADPHLGGLSSYVDVAESEDGNQDTEIPGWAVTFVRLAVTYHYRHETP